jgi:hypothetical protein
MLSSCPVLYISHRQNTRVCVFFPPSIHYKIIIKYPPPGQGYTSSRVSQYMEGKDGAVTLHSQGADIYVLTLVRLKVDSPGSRLLKTGIAQGPWGPSRVSVKGFGLYKQMA